MVRNDIKLPHATDCCSDVCFAAAVLLYLPYDTVELGTDTLVAVVG